jgi:hypothetical protein
MISTTTRRQSYTISTLNVQAINRVLGQIASRLDAVEGIGQNPDLHGSTLKNAGVAVGSKDVIRKDQSLTLSDVDQHLSTRIDGVATGYLAGSGITLSMAGKTLTISLKQQTSMDDAETSHSIPDPGDSPASADALRDDLASSVLPAIVSALNGLGVAVNQIISRLENAEVIES